ncbi:MAG: glycogen debranching protein, partial [Lentisphaerae bacterium]
MLMAGIEFDFTRDECLNLEHSLRQEWLETDGRGGYAASTIIDCHTRKYHGLLNVPVPSQNGVFVLLSKLEAAVEIHGNIFHLSTNKFPCVFNPTGHKYIELFRSGQYPMTIYRIGDIQLRRSLVMQQGSHTTLIRYDLLSADLPITLKLSPLLAYRNRHSLRTRSEQPGFRVKLEENVCRIDNTEGLPPLYLDTSMDLVFDPSPYWVNRIEYMKELSRGYEYQEDLYCPGVFELKLHAGDTLILRASVDKPEKDPLLAWKAEIARRQSLFNHLRRVPHPVRQLKARTEQFIIRDDNGVPGIIAGY